jgi:transglutaminase-like putative cysteine protease
MEKAWATFGGAPSGWGRVEAICDFVHRHVAFGCQFARATRTAAQAFDDQRGVYREFAHLAITFCRCLNIPARYCTGVLGRYRCAPDPAPIDFSAWFEAFVGGRWWTFDARHNVPRIGRVLMARGRDAADVAIGTTAGHDYGNGITGGIGPVAPGLGWVEICRSGTSATSSSSLTKALLTRPPRRSCGLCLTGKYQR